MFELMNLKKDGTYYAYVRKSRADITLENYKKIDTLKQHENFIKKRAEQLEIKINKWYKEVVSGDSIEERPEVKKLLSEIETGNIDGVIVVDVDRLARGDTTDQGIISRTFKYSNTKIITLYKIYDPKNEEDEDFFEFNLFMARKEYKAINKRQQRGRISSVLSGKFCGSIAPYGYDKVKIKGDKGFTLTPNKEEVKIVKTIFAKRKNGIGLNIICNYLNNLSIRPRKSDVWTPATLKTILTNPVYIGKIRWGYNAINKKIKNGEIIKNRQKSRDGDYIMVEGLHERIIDDETFNKVQNSKVNALPVTNNHELKNPLAGVVKCSICGRNMVRRPYNKAQVRVKSNLNKAKLLKCLREHKNHSLREIADYCGYSKYTVDRWFTIKLKYFVVPPVEAYKKLKTYLNITTNEFDEDIENYHKKVNTVHTDVLMCPKSHCENVSSDLCLVEDKILLITTEYLKQKKQLLKNYNLQNASQDFKMIDVLNKKIKELNTKLDKAYDLVENGVYTAEEFTNRANKIKKQINLNKKELSKLNTLQNKDTKQMVALADKVLENYKKTSNIEDKNKMLKSIIECIEYTKIRKNEDFILKIAFKF